MRRAAVLPASASTRPRARVPRPRWRRSSAPRPTTSAFPSSVAHGVSLLADSLDWRPGDNVVLEGWEFPSLLLPWLAQAAARRGGAVCGPHRLAGAAGTLCPGGGRAHPRGRAQPRVVPDRRAPRPRGLCRGGAPCGRALRGGRLARARLGARARAGGRLPVRLLLQVPARHARRRDCLLESGPRARVAAAAHWLALGGSRVAVGEPAADAAPGHWAGFRARQPRLRRPAHPRRRARLPARTRHRRDRGAYARALGRVARSAHQPRPAGDDPGTGRRARRQRGLRLAGAGARAGRARGGARACHRRTGPGARVGGGVHDRR